MQTGVDSEPVTRLVASCVESDSKVGYPALESDRESSADFSVVRNPHLFPLNLLSNDSSPPRTSSWPSTGQSARDEAPGDEESTHDCESRHWWLIHTKPKQEKRFADELRIFGVSHYLPVTKCTAVTRGRNRVTRAPLFSGYLFMKGNADQRLTALKTNRTVAIHRVRDQTELEGQLWDLADLIEKEVPLRIEDRLVPGQYVRVKSGLLTDKRGVVIKQTGKSRLFIFVNDLLGGVSLEIEPHRLEPY